MALKADRYELQTDISFFYNDVAKSRGGVLVHDSTTASGAAMDQGVNLVKKHTSGTPVGILLNDVVNKDLTRTHLNQHKDEVQKGGKVTVLRKGYVITNAIEAAGGAYVAPTAGAAAYSSTTTAGNLAAGNTSGVLMGRFLGGLDYDGYAKIEINLP